MLQQYSFQSKENPAIYLVPTPIGNLQEMSNRALTILKTEVSKIFCEDTRVTQKLLNYFDFQKPLISLHQYNEEDKYNLLLNELAQGNSVAIVSDAGYPLISDPGFYVIHKILTETNYNVIPLSGPNAGLNALVASGFNPQNFYFYGFLPRKKRELDQELNNLKNITAPIIFYESPHRILNTLQAISKSFNENIDCCVAKEITKINEQFFRGKLKEVLNCLMNNDKVNLGEYVIIIKSNESLIIDKNFDFKELMLKISLLITEEKYYLPLAIKQIAKENNVSRNWLYKQYQQWQKEK